MENNSRERSKNFTLDEDRKLREEFTRYRDYLTAPQSNKVTNRGKTEIWQKIAESRAPWGMPVEKQLPAKPDGRICLPRRRKSSTNIVVKQKELVEVRL